jgi:hypothetical protein
VDEILASDQPEVVCQELDELAEMLLLLREQLINRVGPAQ